MSIAILVIAGFAAASDAPALGFGRVPHSVPLGQALDLSVPLRLEAGESLAPGCVQAEIHVGEQRLAADTVVVRLEQHGTARGDLRLRIRSNVVVREPLVVLNLTLGCAGAVSRKFVVLADPPENRGDDSRAVDASRDAERRAPIGARPVSVEAARTLQVAATGARTEANLRTVALSARSVMPQHARPSAAPQVGLAEPAELLKAATLAVAAQDAAVASATLAANTAQAAAAAAEQRLVAMESNLNTLREEAVEHRATTDLMRTRLALAEGPSRGQIALLALVALLGVLALWLGWRVRALLRQHQTAGRHGANGALQPGIGEEPAGAAAETAPALFGQVESAAQSVEVQPPPSQTAAAPLQPDRADDTLTRPASVDELIDLEQEVEFFLLLGEAQSAVDLLNSHLRRTGGTSPLPYLKLLEIQRRRGEREAYERIRHRFSQQFNAVAPTWDADAAGGRDLQDYPAVLDALQACWREPSQAMAELAKLLYGGGEVFDLPAYRDVLTLYAVARDLHRGADAPTCDVDMLLPLALSDEPLLTAPASIFDTVASGHAHGRRHGHGDALSASRSTASVDLDLSEPPLVPESRAGESGPLRVTLGEGVRN